MNIYLKTKQAQWYHSGTPVLWALHGLVHTDMWCQVTGSKLLLPHKMVLFYPSMLLTLNTNNGNLLLSFKMLSIYAEQKYTVRYFHAKHIPSKFKEIVKKKKKRWWTFESHKDLVLMLKRKVVAYFASCF